MIIPPLLLPQHSSGGFQQKKNVLLVHRMHIEVLIPYTNLISRGG